MGKKILKFLGLLFLVVVIWFSFIKTYDHHIQFKVDVPAGTMYDLLLKENTWVNLNKELKIKDYNKFKSIQQELNVNGLPFNMLWTFENKNDTNAIVHLDFTNEKHSLKERYLSLFKSSENLDSLIKLSQSLKTKANNFSKAFKIEINGIDSIPKMTYLYVSQNTMRIKKAGDMIQNNARLFVKNQDSLVTKTGNTFVYVKDWDLETDSIHFRYAFPVKSKATYPIDDIVNVDTLEKQAALKATFYGNYSLSDQAWLALYHYAERNEIDIDLTPIEIFYNNPMLGGDDKKWKAEIFMPIKNSSR